MVKESLDIHYNSHYVGALLFEPDNGLGYFEYDASFIKTGIELSPIKMPLANKVYSFPTIDESTFFGLPGLIADSLPDDFGNAVLNAWMARQGKNKDKITPIQRLQYTGKRGMGALEYTPATQIKSLNASQQVEINSLVNIAQEVLNSRENFALNLSKEGSADQEAMMALLSVGMSAGGARPKAVLAFNENFSQVKSGQTSVPNGFTHYIMKFDGVSEHNTNKETFGDPLGYSAMEYVYFLMAKDCGIEMMPCYLLDEGPRRHFISQRFDRKHNTKIHTQTLNSLVHQSYKKVGSYSYEEIFAVARKLQLPADQALQLFRRMVFNVIARNHDDHSKNFSFIYQDNQWRLSPAYDIVYSYKPGSFWVDKHWMTLNGKRDNFERKDFYAFSALSPIFKKNKIDEIIDQTISFVANWSELAKLNAVPKGLITEVNKNLRLSI